MKDRRRAVLEGALFSPNLSYAEKVYLATVSTIKAEFVDGERRHGSRSMGPDGKFSLHLDYLAGAMSSSPEAVRKIQRSLGSKRFLDQVHEGRFGRPTTWQALRIRGAKNGSLTPGEKGTPYGIGDWLVRGADSAPLTYKTPDGGDHTPTSGGIPLAVPTVSSRREARLAHQPVDFHLAVCAAHGDLACSACPTTDQREVS